MSRDDWDDWDDAVDNCGRFSDHCEKLGSEECILCPFYSAIESDLSDPKIETPDASIFLSFIRDYVPKDGDGEIPF